MDLKLNIAKKGLSTTESEINEEYTLRFGHIFRGMSAYEQAQKGGYTKSKDEFEHDLATMLTEDDVVDNLTTTDKRKPLSAKQGHDLWNLKVGNVVYESDNRRIVGKEKANGYLQLFSIDAAPFIDAIEVNFSHAQLNLRDGSHKEEFAALAETFSENVVQNSRQPVAVIDQHKGCVIFATSVTYDFGNSVFRINANMNGVYTIDIKVDGTVTRAEYVKELEQLSNAVANKVDKVEGKGLSTNDYTDADKELVQSIPTLNKNVAKNTADIKTKQDTLTLTTKPNGNIVIGNIAGQSKEFMAATPSGDPMHYAYEAAGAVWNEDTGYWEFYDMKDITNIEMSRALARGSWYAGPSTIGVLAAFNSQSLNAIRFNVARTGAWGVTQDMDYFATTNSYIEFVNMTHDNNLVAMPFTYVTYLNESFNGCSNLRRIYGELELSNVNGVRDAFKGCAKLESVLLYGLKYSISFADSPLLSKESLLYMINNCASDVSFTIILHPDAHNRCYTEWLEDIDNALGTADNKQTVITLARA